jgi:hypothetical protein
VRFLFLLLRIFGDARAISRGRYHKRVYNRAVLRGARRFLFWR